MLPLKSSLPRFRITPIGIFFGSVPLVLAMLWLFQNQYANFRSSDYNWARHQSSKSPSFIEVASSFEEYRLKCHAESAQLVRTTKMRWWNIFAWHSYASDPKWNVPYGKTEQRTESTYPRDLSRCPVPNPGRGLTFDESKLISERSHALVRSFDDGA
jgi:hypothetical protein